MVRNLFDIYGKPAAAIEGYDYSDALKASSLVWNDKNLAEFVSNPEQFVKGTKARFPGLKTAKDKGRYFGLHQIPEIVRILGK